MGFPDGSDDLPAMWAVRIRSPGEENGNPLQYCCLGNPMDRGAWQASVHGVAESDMTEVSYHARSIMISYFVN